MSSRSCVYSFSWCRRRRRLFWGAMAQTRWAQAVFTTHFSSSRKTELSFADQLVLSFFARFLCFFCEQCTNLQFFSCDVGSTAAQYGHLPPFLVICRIWIIYCWPTFWSVLQASVWCARTAARPAKRYAPNLNYTLAVLVLSSVLLQTSDSLRICSRRVQHSVSSG